MIVSSAVLDVLFILIGTQTLFTLLIYFRLNRLQGKNEIRRNAGDMMVRSKRRI